MVDVVIGAGGGLGAAFMALRGPGTLGLSRRSTPALDLADEASIAACAARVAAQGKVELIIDATGFLHGPGMMPEKTLAALNAEQLAHNFALNAIGPALVMKHFLPLLPRESRGVFVALSAKVGSITDNQVGGWYGYRASKAALNQFVRTAAVELARKNPHSLCIAMHPGTVATALSAPFAKAGLNVRPPLVAAADMLAVIAKLGPEATGRFWSYDGKELPW